jgi:hypothetical protein
VDPRDDPEATQEQIAEYDKAIAEGREPPLKVGQGLRTAEAVRNTLS